MQMETVTLRFTDNPLPPPSASRKSAELPVGGKTVRALWDSLQKTIDRILDGSVQRKKGSHNRVREGAAMTRATAAGCAFIAATVLGLWSNLAQAAADGADVDRAIGRGLEWLAAHQSRLGHWTATGDAIPPP